MEQKQKQEQEREQQFIIMGQRIKEERINTTPQQMLARCEDSRIKQQRIITDDVVQTIRSIRSTKISIDSLANILNVGRSTIIRAESGNVGKRGAFPLRTEKLVLFCLLTGTHLKYIEGETDIRNEEAYRLEEEKALDEAAHEYERKRKKKNEENKTLFSLLGYTYENIEDSAAYCFDGLNGAPRYTGPHKISASAINQNTVYLSDEEFERLKEDLSNIVALTCFRIERKECLNHGNS